MRALADPLICPHSGPARTALGLLRLTLLKKLKNSTRNWKYDSFLAGMFLKAEKSGLISYRMWGT